MQSNLPGSDPYGYPPPRPPPRAVRERSGCLNLWLIASIVFGLIALFGLIQVWELVLRTPNAFQRVSPIGLILLSALLIGMLICVWGIWRWKRWAVYGIALTSIVSPFVEYAFFRADASDVIAPFIQIAVLYFLVKDKWDDFE